MHNFLARWTMAAVAAGLIAGCGATAPTKQAVSETAMANPIQVDKVTAYSKSAVVPVAVRNECEIQSQLPEFVESFASQNNVAVVRKGAVSPKTKGRVLEMEIVNLIGTGGGAWSGAKSVTVEGKLYDNGKMIGSFTGRRLSGGGFFGGYKGTCSILGRCVKAIGKDISLWLKSPTMNARFGDL